MPSAPSTFAARLKHLRVRSGQSLQKAADAVAISKPHFWELEAGSSSNPSKDLLERIASHYKVSVAYLLGDETEKDGELGALFRDMQGLTEQQRDQLRALVDAMNKPPKE